MQWMEWMHSIDLKVVLPRSPPKSFYVLPEAITREFTHWKRTAAKRPLCHFVWTLRLHHYDIKYSIEEKQCACYHVLMLAAYKKTQNCVCDTPQMALTQDTSFCAYELIYTHRRVFNKV